jgi:hypothetical protein
MIAAFTSRSRSLRNTSNVPVQNLAAKLDVVGA